VNFSIKLYFAAMLALLAVAQDSFAAVETHFSAGVTAYEAGQFELAAQNFSASPAETAASGTLLNLGLANWRCGRIGGAILAWEQVAWLDPFNRDARNNLSFARETASVDALELTWYEEASTWLPVNWWTWLAVGSLWLAMAFVTLPGFFRMRKAAWHQTVAALSLGVFILSLAPSVGIVTRSNVGIVLENQTSLRLTPTQSAESTASLPSGEPVRELRRHGDYFFVHTQNGNGWVEQRQIGFLVPTVR
jgi:hypothetical protein